MTRQVQPFRAPYENRPAMLPPQPLIHERCIMVIDGRPEKIASGNYTQTDMKQINDNYGNRSGTLL